VIRIAYVIPTLDRSGAEKQLSLLATHLPRDEFDPHVIALTRGGPYGDVLRAANVPVTLLGKRLRFDPFSWWRLRRVLRELRPDVVHSWLFAANSYARLAARRRSEVGGQRSEVGLNYADLRPPTSDLRSPKVIVSERCVDSWKSGWQLALDRRLIPRTDRLIANSTPVADFYRHVGYPPERISVIPNAVEPPPPPTFTREQLLAQLDLPPDAQLVAHVGRLAKQKRIDDLLWSAQVLRQADPRVYLLVVGDGPERDRLIHYARQVEVTEHVRFLGHRDDAASLMHLIDVFWLGSDFEGMSNSLMEAMACGRPVVVTDIPPNRELVTHGEHGYVVPIGDSTAFAQFTLKLLNEPDLAAAMGQAARRRMADEFSLDRMVQSHVALYRSILGSS
jgi:glycosyltransferase involved in cell wall biosynthesis